LLDLDLDFLREISFPAIDFPRFPPVSFRRTSFPPFHRPPPNWLPAISHFRHPSIARSAVRRPPTADDDDHILYPWYPTTPRDVADDMTTSSHSSPHRQSLPSHLLWRSLLGASAAWSGSRWVSCNYCTPLMLMLMLI